MLLRAADLFNVDGLQSLRTRKKRPLADSHCVADHSEKFHGGAEAGRELRDSGAVSPRSPGGALRGEAILPDLTRIWTCVGALGVSVCATHC
jgi:hypothetical protein